MVEPSRVAQPSRMVQPSRVVQPSRRTFLTVAAVASGSVLLPMTSAGGAPSAAPAPGDADTRAQALIDDMTLDEKIGLVHGMPSATYIGYVPGLARLKIPALLLTDGPAGIRTPKQTSGPSTAFPAPIALAAAFDDRLARRVGVAFGSEAKAKAQNVVFAPIVNLARVPEGGRLFEGFGEDPHLTTEMGVAVIHGIQSMGVIATVKHWIGNDQEDNRHLVDAQIDERTLREVYLPPFAAAISRGHVGSVMAANNQTNGAYNAENATLQRDLLKGELGFRGFVCSDYAATHDPIAAAIGGLDLDLPGDANFGAPLKAAVEAGEVAMADLDDKVLRILRTMISFGIYDGAGTSERGGPGAANTPQNAALAREVAELGTVLLKNAPAGTAAAPLLPLAPGIGSIAALGPFAATPRIGGDGSSHVVPLAAVSPVDALTARFPAATVTTAPGAIAAFSPVPTAMLTPPGGAAGNGLLGEYYANVDLSGTPALTRQDATVAFGWNVAGPGSGLPTENFSVRWTGTLTPTESGTHTLAVQSDDGARLWIGEHLVVDDWGDHDVRRRSGVIQLTAGQGYPLRLEYYQATFRAQVALQWIAPAEALIAAAVTAAAAADVAVLFVSDLESEGLDRENLSLPGQQDELISAVAAANPRTIVVSNAGGPVLMPWIDDVPAVVAGWFGGQQDGDAITAVLAGDVNPGGRLPVTFGRHAADYPARHPWEYPGEDFVEYYAEGPLIGYRHFDAAGIEPLFCFGHGLSYTDFTYHRLHVPRAVLRGSAVTIRVTVRNHGDVRGDEVVQLYLGQPGNGAPTPRQVLRGYRRVTLDPGHSRTISFTLAAADLARWDVRRHAWVVPTGRYEIRVGASSRDIRLRAAFTVRRRHHRRAG